MTRLPSLLFAFAACSSHGTPAHPAPGHDAGAVRPAEPPTAAECDGLFDHAIDLQAAEAKLSPDERAKLHGELRERSLARCRAMPRSSYTCALAASTLEAFTSCDSAQP